MSVESSLPQQGMELICKIYQPGLSFQFLHLFCSYLLILTYYLYVDLSQFIMYENGCFRLFTNFSEIKNPR